MSQSNMHPPPRPTPRRQPRWPLPVAAAAAVAVTGLALAKAPPLVKPNARPTRAQPARVIELHTPGDQRILLRGAVIRLGSTIAEVATAQAMCRLEPLK
ncbi:MAG TPA: hypothetical protein ENK23_03145, partial [Sorangium sp.]|nr:hypothetical protein [Sorangium sp.]